MTRTRQGPPPPPLPRPAAAAARTVAAPHVPARVNPEAPTIAASSGDDARAEAALGSGRVTVLPRVVGHDVEVRLETDVRARYSIARTLGAGAMGEVELGQDHDIGRPVALKRLADGSNSTAAVARFVDEVRTMGALDHPNITPIYDVGRDERGRLFFAMKYVEGESLEDLIGKLAAGDPKTHADFPLARRLDIFVGILNALDHAHAQGILHRDIKPANVMLGAHGEVRLMDWGIARRRSAPSTLGTGDAPQRPDMTHDGAVLGTPLYMSPEQARGDQAAIDARSDLYSAFVLLFELLTLRRHVGDGHDVHATLQRVIEAREVPLDGPVWTHPTQGAVPTELRHFLRRGLRGDPADRFQSAREVVWHLERVRSGEIAVQCPITAFKASQQRVSRIADAKPKLFLSVVIALVASLAGLVVLAALGAAALM